MKKYGEIVICLYIGMAALRAQGQGSFQNLNFEAANVSGYPPNSTVPGTNAMPGWNGSFFGYDAISFGGSLISLIDTNAGFGFNPLQGRYSAVLFGGAGGPVTLSQTGLVPAGTESLQVQIFWIDVPPVVSLGGQTLEMVPLQTFANYTLYGANVSTFAGHMEELQFLEAPPASNPPDWAILDDIRFSTQPIPEPDAFGLFGLGAVVAGWRLRRAGK
jgi:hypothetical protein